MIGTKHIQAAIEMINKDQFNNHILNENMIKFQIVRIPFFLETSYFDKPDDYSEAHDIRMHRKFGGKEAFEIHAIQHALVPRAAAVGLDKIGFTEENLAKRRQSSTLRSHLLVYYIAKKYSFEMSEKLYNVLNRKHFTEGGILNDIHMLLSAVQEVGADVEDCELFLKSKVGIDAVFRTVEEVHKLGIHSIPTLIISGEYMIGGTASIEDIYKLLSKVVEIGQKNGHLFGKRRFKSLMEF